MFVLASRLAHPPGRLRALFVLCLALVAGVAAGCASTVGDGCTSNANCAYGQQCDTSPPGGYCIIPDCRPNSCPSEAWCANFQLVDRTRAYCLRKCSANGDCRDGYKCRTDLGTPGGVCYVAPATTSP